MKDFDLSWLCNGDESRVTERPFSAIHSDIPYDIATDGHVLIALVDDDCLFDGKEPDHFKECIQLFNDAADLVDAVPESSIEIPLPESVTYENCPKCRGRGKVRHHCDCERCDYSGDEECGECEGTGGGCTKSQTVKFDGHWFNGAHMALIAAIFGRTSKASARQKVIANHFPYVILKFGNGYAIVMPMRAYEVEPTSTNLNRLSIGFINGRIFDAAMKEAK